jgi:malonate transporter
LTDLHINGPLGTIVDWLAVSAIPCALIALGVSLRRHGVDPNLGFAAVLTALKLVVHPALVYVFAFKIFSMPPMWAGVAVLFAAMPSGINSYLFAEQQQPSPQTRLLCRLSAPFSPRCFGSGPVGPGNH